MKMRILAGAAVLALVAGMTSSAMASEHKSRRHHGRVLAAKHGGQPARVRPMVDSGYRDLGPLGVMFGCGARPCSTGYSVSAWSY